MGLPVSFLPETEAQLRAKEAAYAATEVHPVCAATADLWVKRSPLLQRVTDKTPLIMEAPMHLLYEAGFLTPSALHYVTNHGKVPMMNTTRHTLTVTVNPKKTRSFSVDNLRRMHKRTLPVTLVDAAFRGKELAMHKAVAGPLLSGGAMSTGLWSGVPLRTVLHKCGVKRVTNEAQFLHFAGPPKQAPGKGVDGSVGMCLPLAMCLDESNDILIAYELNHLPLGPDQGAPLRMIVPGLVGNYSVKHLSSMRVAKEHSDNFFFLRETTRLPLHVPDAAQATKEKLWGTSEYRVTHAQLNSVVSSPAHNDVVMLQEHGSVTLKGFAYAGAGAAVEKVEISLDGGATWREATCMSTETPTTHGKRWCWVLWSLRVSHADVSAAASLKCRATAAGGATQQEGLAWNAQGLCNNCIFTVKMEKKALPGGTVLAFFKHPTAAGGQQKGGWMGDQPGAWVPSSEEAVVEVARVEVATVETAAPAKTAAAVAAAPPAAAVAAAPSRIVKSADGRRLISMKEVAQHDQEDDVWIVIAGKVYDCTRYLPDHPGGADSITINAGTDTTEEFEAIHSKKAWKQLEPWYIGDVATDEEIKAAGGDVGEVSSAVTTTTTAPTSPPTVVLQPDYFPFPKGPIALDPKNRIPMKLIKREDVSWNSRIYTFALQSKKHVWGLPVGKHVMCAAKVNGKLVMRAYTPISTNDELGVFRLLIKTYFKTEQYPEGGAMTMHMEEMKIGDHLDIKGPIGHIQYKGMGYWMNGKTEVHAKHMAMIAGGTGITPMWQFIVAGLSLKKDPTVFHVIYSNTNWDDILLRDELSKLAKKHPNRLKLYHTLTRAQPTKWTQGVGRITQTMFESVFPKGGADTSGFVCGSEGFNSTSIDFLKAMGYDENRIGVF